MSGAAILAGMGGLRSGAGLVHLGVPQGILPIVATAEPSYLTIPLTEDEDGIIDRAAAERLNPRIDHFSSIAIGPGVGQSLGVTALVRFVYLQADRPRVIDADALNALAAIRSDELSIPDRANDSPVVLTPHPGEFARLVDLEVAEVQARREELAVEFAQHHSVVLLLKGKDTVVTDGERIAINRTGNHGMATGGTGDVLTGLIAGLLAQGMDAFEATRLGAHLHGLAGDLAAEELSEPGLIASDLPKFLGKAWLKLVR